MIEAQFDGGLNPRAVKLDLVYELSPERIPSDLVDAATRRRVVAAFAKRGGKGGDALAFETAASDEPDGPVSPPRSAADQRQIDDGRRLARCVARADGDVAAIQRCQQR